TIGNGGQIRLEPRADAAGPYAAKDGGATVHEGLGGHARRPRADKPRATRAECGEGTGGALPPPNRSFGITDVGLDPLSLDVVYASGFDAGVWRRDAGAAATAFQQVFPA